jgi:hypothetical protein
MASAEDYAKWIVDNRDKQGTPEFETVAKAYQMARDAAQPQQPRQPAPEPAFEREARETVGVTGPELIAGARPTRFALGAASPILGAAQLGARNPVGRFLGQDKWIDERIARIEELKKRGMKAYRQEGLDIAGMAGAVLSPVFGGPAKSLPVAATLGGRMMQGATLGAVAGATTPVEDVSDFAGTKATQAITGAAVGAIIPPIATLGAKIKRGATNILNPAVIKGRAFLEAAGDKADEIMSLLRENKQIVRGSLPTAGEAAAPAGGARFSALQRSARDVLPDEYWARQEAQNAARLRTVRTVGQDAAALTRAEEARTTAAGPLYKAAREGTAPVDTANVLEKVDGLLAKNPGNRELVAELKNVRTGLVDAEGNLRTDPQQVASVLDGLKAAIADEKNKFIRSQLTNIKDRLKKSIPGMEAADVVFRAKSEPINQMQIGQYLEQKLTPALSEEAPQRAATYAGALRDAPGTIKRATGAPRFDNLSQALTPKQLEAVTAVRDDLARSARFEQMGRFGAKAQPGAGELGQTAIREEIGGNIPGILERGVFIVRALIYRVSGHMDKKLAAEVAAEMLNPPRVAETLRQAQLRATKNDMLATAIHKRIIRPATVAAAQAPAREQATSQEQR